MPSSLTRNPREWAAPGTRYGQTARPTWHTPHGHQQTVELDAAILQHHIIRRVRAAMTTHGYPSDAWTDLATAVGIHDTVLGKLMRGDRPLHLIHITALQHHLGPLI